MVLASAPSHAILFILVFCAGAAVFIKCAHLCTYIMLHIMRAPNLFITQSPNFGPKFGDTLSDIKEIAQSPNFGPKFGDTLSDIK